MKQVSVILCTYRPNPVTLRRVWASLRGQSLAPDLWEAVIVDSASPDPVAEGPLRAEWGEATVVRAPEPGLALARTVGFAAARAPLLAFVDDDTLLEADYLRTAVEFLLAHPGVEAVSGRIGPEFESPPPPWLGEFGGMLALRDFGPGPLTAGPARDASGRLVYPAFAPVGCNVCRREAFARYETACRTDPERLKLGRKGSSLASGEDNDFILSILRHGGEVGYCPEMRLTHIIPSRRLDPAYLARLNRASSRTWVQVLLSNECSPWPAIPAWTLGLRKIKAWFALRAWSGPAARIRYAGACGLLEGRVRP